jgi:hypothetical protein
MTSKMGEASKRPIPLLLPLPLSLWPTAAELHDELAQAVGTSHFEAREYE